MREAFFQRKIEETVEKIATVSNVSYCTGLISNELTDSFQKSKSFGKDLVFKEKVKLSKNR